MDLKEKGEWNPDIQLRVWKIGLWSRVFGAELRMHADSVVCHS